MKKIVHYIGLDVHKETVGAGREGADILAALARRSRKVWDDLFVGDPGWLVPRDPGLSDETRFGVSKWPAAGSGSCQEK
jgi:hypothetical protein